MMKILFCVFVKNGKNSGWGFAKIICKKVSCCCLFCYFCEEFQGGDYMLD